MSSYHHHCQLSRVVPTTHLHVSCVLCLCDTSKCFEAVINLTSSLPTGFRESDSEASEMLTNTFVKEVQRKDIKTSCNVIFCVFVISFFLVFKPFIKSFSHCNWTNFVRLVFLFICWLTAVSQRYVSQPNQQLSPNQKQNRTLSSAHCASAAAFNVMHTTVLQFTRVLL